MSLSRQPANVHPQKRQLVALGLLALSRGEFGIVAAITQIIEARGWGHV